MKGKKVDAEFVSDFITQSIRDGCDSPDQIVSRAKEILNQIDEELKKIEEKRSMRSKLLDVISSFEKPVKTQNVEQVRILSFFQIQNPHICKDICQVVKKWVMNLDQLNELCYSYSKDDIVFCVKQLLEHKIISKNGEKLLRGTAFEDYLKFVLREGA